MSHAIIRGANGRRHKVDFGDEPLEAFVHVSDLVVEAPDHDHPPGKRRFALLNVLREQFASAFGQAVRRSVDKGGVNTLLSV